MTQQYANNLYDSLFCGKVAAPTAAQEAELKAMELANAARIAQMSEEEKHAEFNRVMGRNG